MKTKGGMTPRQRRKARKQEDRDMLLKANSGMSLDELYDDEPAPPVETKEAPPVGSIDQLLAEYGDDPEVEEKMMDDYVPEPAPTSFDELDKKRDEMEKMHKVRMISYDAEDIVSGIIRSPELSPEEKAKRMAKAGEDMSQRINRTLGMSKEAEPEFDYDVASTEILLSMEEKEKKGVLDRIVALFKTEQKSEEQLKREEILKSLSEVLEMLKEGGESAEKARESLPELRETAKEIGIGQPSEQNNNGIIVHKGDDGEYRFVGWLTGKWIDREGDIIEEKAHKEKEQFLVDNPDYPISFRSWHTTGTDREHPIDFWKYENGFVIVSGLLTEPEAVNLMKAQQKRRIGMSHGFIGYRDEQDPRIIKKYRTFEVSDLPLDNAAFPWSEIPEIMEVKSMNTKIEYLAEVIGEDRLKTILADTEVKKSFLEQSGIEEKQLDALLSGEEIPVEPAPETKEEDRVETPELSAEVVGLLKSALGMDEFDPKEFKAALEKAQAVNALLPAMAARLDEISTQLEAKQKSAEDQLAELLTPKATKAVDLLSKSQTKSGANVVGEDDEQFKDVAPKHENTWLAEAAKVAPVEAS